MVDRTISTISVYSQTNFRFLMQPLWCSSLIFCTASLMLMLIALFTPYWVTESTPHGLLHGGLWSICLDPDCDFYPINLAWFVHTTRTFLVLGTTCGFLALCCVSFSFIRTQVNSVSVVLLSSIFSITAGTLSLFGMCIFTYIYKNSRPYTQHLIIFGPSYSLAWACIPMFIITGFCIMIAMSVCNGTFGPTNRYGWSFGLDWTSFPLYFLTVLNIAAQAMFVIQGSQLASNSIPDLLARDRPETFVPMNVLQFGAVFFCFISLLCLLAALGSDYWIVNSRIHLGLWKICDGGTCISLGVKSASAAIHATRTFMFLGMIAGVVSLIGLCTLNNKCRLGSTSISASCIAYVSSFIAGFCIMIAMSIFTGTIGGTNQYGWSFGLGWASFPLYFLTGSLLYILHKNTATSA